MSSGFLFALMFGVWIGNVVVVDGTAAACVETKIGNDEMKIDGCQSHAYGVSWAENRTLDFFFSADVTEHTKYDTQLGDRNCFLNVTSVKDNGKYVLSYRSYKAESGSFKLQLTADGKLQTGDNTVVCDNVPIESSSINHLSTVAYFSIAQGEIENFSVAIKAQDIAARAITQLLSTTTTVVSSSTSTAVPIGSTAEKEEK
ncbi:hypothetical protein M3Y96_00882600 [Aphelenchoides besseyi]|nr:hypothetical protein M3Y96_00882600 [Aphelenchoides besseyi]